MDRNIRDLLPGGGIFVALRKESVDRNIRGNPYLQIGRQSLSARRAWIEIRHGGRHPEHQHVALRKESVDRNTFCLAAGNQVVYVALRKESVDRNVPFDVAMVPVEQVALRKESVDRNCDSDPVTDKAWTSLSARRAWIEISLLKASKTGGSGSLSARRAWIEISASGPHGTASEVALRKESVDRNADAVNLACKMGVALRKESVDRNAYGRINDISRLSRSPQGERG